MSKTKEKNQENSKKEEVDKNLEKEKMNQEKPNEKDEIKNNPKEEIDQLKKDKLLLLAEIDNKQKQFRKQMEEVYKYSNKKLIL